MILEAEMIKYIKIISILLIIFILLSCTNEQKKIKDLQVLIMRNANQISKDFRLYINVVEQIADYTNKLFDSQDEILPEIDISRYKIHSSNVMYSEEDDNRSVVFVSGYNKINDLIKKHVYITEPLDSIFIDFKNKFPEIYQFYYIDSNSFKRVYPPIDVLIHYQPNINFLNLNTYYTANKKFNPDRKPLWIKEPYINQFNKNLVISVLAPVYQKDNLKGVTGFDINANSISQKWIKQSKDFKSFIMTSTGNIVTTDVNLSKLLNIPNISSPQFTTLSLNNNNAINEINLTKSKYIEVRNLALKIISDEQYFITSLNDETYYVLCEKINLMDWILVYLVKK